MRQGKIVFAALGALVALAAAPAAHAAPTPAWSVSSIAAPTHFEPGDESGKATYETFLANSGGAPTDKSPITITDTLPPGVGVKSVELLLRKASSANLIDFAPGNCDTELSSQVTTVSCEVDEAIANAQEPAHIWPGEQIRLLIHLKVPAEEGPSTNRVEVQGGGAPTASTESHNEISFEAAPSGFQYFKAELTGPEGEPVTGAASHPYQYTTSFAVNTAPAPPTSVAPYVPAEGAVKDIEVKLPPGLIGNPSSVKQCTFEQFNTLHGVSIDTINYFPNNCPDGAAVGLIAVQQLEGAGGDLVSPIYNLTPPKGMPAQLGFQVVGAPFYIDTSLRSDSDYGISAHLRNSSEAKRVTAASVTIWGTPAHPSHDRLRGSCDGEVRSLGICPAEIEARPFWRLPSSCASPLKTSFNFNTWPSRDTFISSLVEDPAPVQCDLPDFSPTIEATPTTNVADAPSGLHFDLHLPQEANEDPDGLSHADLRDAVVTLPEGFVVNPSSADGLDACSLSQIGYRGVREGRHTFSAEPAECPNASKVGNVSVDTPLVDHPLPGAVYLATPHQNPFNNLITIYIAIHDPETGVVVKLAGEISADPSTGRLTTRVEQNPQTPFEDFVFDFFEGARAPLRTPAVCGTHTTNTEMTPWTAPAGSSAFPSDSFATTVPAVGQGACPTGTGGLPNSPSFEAGTRAPVAGAYQPFSLRLARKDGSQELKGLDLTLPPGLTGKLAGLAYCSDAALAGASSKVGKAEQVSPSCPDSSKLGTVTVGAGAGPAPYYAKGTAYLAGPYKGAPISMAVITPAVAGPFDLGTVVVRAALQVDPETARIHAVSDPLPTILEGIPLDVRSIAIEIDRDRFTLNPTSCDPFAFSGQAFSALNQSAALNQRFQVGGCQELAFEPKLSLRLKGGTTRGKHPALTATLRMPSGGANIAKAAVALPHSIFLDQAHIRTICTRVQFAAENCPKGAVYGYVKAWTPLLDQPLQGPVYLRSSDNPLPDLVADLNGQIPIVLHGRTDSIRGGIRNTFEGVPDAPASKVVLSLNGGKRGLLVNSRNLCKAKSKATATFTAQSGMVSETRPPLEADCGAKGKKRPHRR